MQVLAISFGRPGKNCDILAKQALFGAREAGCDIKFINTGNLHIDRCTGCAACDRVFEKGAPAKLCVHQDDFQFVRNAIMDADGCIFVAPVYSVGVTGQYKNLLDRMGASHDRAGMINANKARLEAGQPGVDPRLFKDRPVAFIPVGGARTPGWTSMGLPMMHLLGVSNLMVPVDAMEGYGMGVRVNPVLDQPYMDRVFQLGKNVGEQVGLPPEKMEWRGDTEGVCPVCHGTTLTYRGEGTKVECTVCGSIGDLSVVDGKIKITYPAEQIARSRYRMGGLIEHQEEMADMGKGIRKILAERGNEIPELLKKFDEIEATRPDKA